MRWWLWALWTYGKQINNCYWTTAKDCLPINCRFVRGTEWPIGRWLWIRTSKLCLLSIFLKDMARILDTPPSVHEASMKGKFVVQRGEMQFSLMAVDQNQWHSITFLNQKRFPISNALCDLTNKDGPRAHCLGNRRSNGPCDCHDYSDCKLHLQKTAKQLFDIITRTNLFTFAKKTP